MKMVIWISLGKFNCLEGTFYMYVLLNKDVIIAKFEVLGKGSLEYISIVSKDTTKIPFWLTDLPTFIINRRAPKHREHIENLLQQYHCDTISGYLDVSHALSLNDTYWVKKESQIDLTWEKVSLYKNKFNDVIARIAFDGGMYGAHFSSTSPEFGTDGTFAKCWIREKGIVKLVKRGTTGYSNAGLEPYSEYYSCQLMEAFEVDHVEYTLTSKSNKIATKCELFTSEQYGLIPYSAISKNGNIGQIVNFYREKGLSNYIAEMLIIDAVMLNEDRHLNNFGFLVENDTGKIIDTAPLFDHNLSLLCYAVESDFDDIYGYIKNNDKGHRLGGDFVDVARELVTSEIRKKLINLHGFEFKKHCRYNLPNWRLEQLNKIVNKQIELILSQK